LLEFRVWLEVGSGWSEIGHGISWVGCVRMVEADGGFWNHGFRGWARMGG
jgi:hypothetical protein